MFWICIATICLEPRRPSPSTEVVWSSSRPYMHSRCHFVLQQLLCTLTVVSVSLATLLPTQIIPFQAISSAVTARLCEYAKRRRNGFYLVKKWCLRKTRLNKVALPTPSLATLHLCSNEYIKLFLANIIHKSCFTLPKEWPQGMGRNVVRRELLLVYQSCSWETFFLCGIAGTQTVWTFVNKEIKHFFIVFSTDLHEMAFVGRDHAQQRAGLGGPGVQVLDTCFNSPKYVRGDWA